MYYFPLAELREMRKQGKLSADTLVRAYELYGEEMINLHLGQVLTHLEEIIILSSLIWLLFSYLVLYDLVPRETQPTLSNVSQRD